MDHNIYFERFVKFDGTMYRKINATIEIRNIAKKIESIYQRNPNDLCMEAGYNKPCH